MRNWLFFLLPLLVVACAPADQKPSGPVDADGDGVPAERDCDDGDAAVGAAGTWYADLDGDGQGDAASADAACDGTGLVANADDCNDDDPEVYLGAEERCNGIDDDCDGALDEELPTTPWYIDADGDGYGAEATALWDCEAPPGTVAVAGDCDDADPAYHPGAPESDCTDPNDYNCDGSVGGQDEDGDGFVACEECNDALAAINPAASEVCNGLDDDCDTAVDDADPSLDRTTATPAYADTDGDGYGDWANSQDFCEMPDGWVANELDCDDGAVAVNPAAAEVCNGIDDDCDGDADDADASLDLTTGSTWYADADGDAYGDDDATTVACDAPVGTSAVAGDCDDSDAGYNPAAAEYCDDPADYNCDGSVGYADGDGDGWAACVECDDTRDAVFPGAEESCNGLDDDCDGTVDEPEAVDAATWYVDADADTYGDPTVTTVACDIPAGFVSDATDCDDAESDVNPGHTEVCNGVDDNCDGAMDEGVTTPWYADVDGDGHGDASVSVSECSPSAGYTASADDCDDLDDSIWPGAPETCDGDDDDCDGTTDEGVTSTWYADADGDGYGDAASSWTGCAAPIGYVSDTTDCDDADSGVHPSATEVCDNLDNDCDALVDDDDPGLDTSTADLWYVDADGDGWGSSSYALACDRPASSAVVAGDCDDSDGTVSPAGAEVCNGVDDDCDGTTDNSSSQYCCSGSGLIHTVPDGCMDDGGGSAGGDAVEVYCYESVARFCLSGESCQWRSGAPSSDDGTTCERSGLGSDYMANSWCSPWEGYYYYYCDSSETAYLR
jgi:hypothetical protein